MGQPLVSVIVISFNHKDFVEQAVRSVCDQTYRNVELIVIDDCSTDGSIDLLPELQKKYAFIYLQNEKNSGLNTSILRAFEKVTGDYVSLFSADDYLVLNKIEAQLDYLDKTGADGVYSNAYRLEGEKVSPLVQDKVFFSGNKQATLEYLYQHDWNAPLLQSSLFKRAVFFDLAQIRKVYKSDDWAFIIKAYQLYDVRFLNEPYVYYRIHPNNTHKNYWFTFPMRIDIISTLVPEEFRLKSLGNILFSQAQYLGNDKKMGRATRMYLASLVLNFSFRKLFLFGMSFVYRVKNWIQGR